MMRVKWLMVLTIMVFFVPAFSQNRMANWVFGDSIVLNFMDSDPVLLSEKSVMRAHEAATSISDANGNLLFYSNNIGVWNRMHQPLFGSEGLNSVSYANGSSKTNGTLFIPVSGDTTDTKIWVLITDDTDHKLRYSLIDQELDSGLGGIVDGRKNMIVYDMEIGEQLTAVKHANGRDWWVILRKGYPNSSMLVSIHLSPYGILDIREFEAGFTAKFQGEMVAAPDGQFIAFASGGEIDMPILGVYSFDRCTGDIDLIDTLGFLDLNKGLYGLAFSPNSRNIYCSSFTFGKDRLYQVNLDSEEIGYEEIYKFSFPGIPTTGNMTGQFELGPDDKIYISRRFISALSGISSYGEYLGVIQFPDEIGVACQFDTFGFYLGGYVNNHTYSLPNFANYDLGPLVGSPCDTLSPQDTTQTGIFNHSAPHGDWSVFPTSSSGLYTLQSDHAGWLIVHDLYGREVLRQLHEQTTPFDLTAQPAGLYLVHLRAADGMQSLLQKIIRQ